MYLFNYFNMLIIIILKKGIEIPITYRSMGEINHGNFEDLVDISLKYNIYKYDSSMLGIGGCPFSENKLVGNKS